MVQWIRLHASNAADAGLIPGQGTKIPHTLSQKKKKKDIMRSGSEFLDLREKIVIVSGRSAKISRWPHSQRNDIGRYSPYL